MENPFKKAVENNEEIENAKLAFEKLKSKVIYIHKYELINEFNMAFKHKPQASFPLLS